MRKIIIPFLILISTFAYSQSIQLIDTVTSVIVDPKVSPTVVKYGVKNISSDSVYIIVAKEVISEVTGTTNYFCWDFCLSPAVDTAGFIMIAPDSVANNFYADYLHNSKIGTTVVKYTFFNRDSIADQVSITVSYVNDDPNSIKETFVRKFELSPNPVQNKFTINYQFNALKPLKFTVFDVLGNIILEKNLFELSGTKSFDASSLDRGIYFYTLAEENQIIKTQKFVVTN